jgi:hypothetical protein
MPMTTGQTSGTLASKIGFVLTRLVVPLWILTGATFKLIERDPRLLPSQIREFGKAIEMNPFDLLAVLLAIEFLAVILMVVSARLARPVAIFMLSVFVLVLLNELRTGNFTNCGCLGKIPVKPWQMLTVDVLLLAGVIFFRHRRNVDAGLPLWKPLAAAVLTIAALGSTFGLLWKEGRPVIDLDPPIINGAAGDTEAPDQPIDPTINPRPASLPNFFTADDASTWVGKPWRELPIFRYMPRWPSNMDEGTRYVVFYSRTCGHCEDMFRFDLVGPIGASVTAVEVPFNRTQMTGSGAWDMPPTECEHLQLPLGALWAFTPPLALKIENGIVTCAMEKDHKQCLGLD